MSDDIKDFVMGSGAKAFAFDSIGDRVTGVITSMQKRQQTDMTSGEPAFWSNGDPKMMLQVTLETDMRESEDDEGMRNVYLRGGNYVPLKGKGTSTLNAVRDAVKRAGADMPTIGGTLTLEYSGTAKGAGATSAKLYTADYKAPTYSVDLDEMA